MKPVRRLGVVCLLLMTAPRALDAQEAVTNPHGALPEGLDCSACHTDEGWRTLRSPLGFDHAKTGFALSGAHAQATCGQCHLDLRFDEPKVAPRECGSCHADVHEGHLVESCADCHTTQSFSDVHGEAIHARTSFPLTGAHRQITCEACHRDDVGGVFTTLPTECSACHEGAFRDAKAPDHVDNAYPTTCTMCHSTVGWTDAPPFDHAAAARGFTLVGVHSLIRCSTCHQVPAYSLLFPKPTDENDCVACHRREYDNVHAGTGFPTTCLTCHASGNWDDGEFDHSTTSFPLVGAHHPLSCAECHNPSNRLDLKPAGPDDCVACHQPDFDKAHGGTVIPTTCTTCHSQTTWAGATADHATLSGGFTLVGVHRLLLCATCHQVPGYSLIFPKPSDENDCVACHRSEYDNVHAGTGFPTTCLTCHASGNWDDGEFDHSTTSFPLVGAHRISCTACHNPSRLDLKPAGPTDCVACHQSDYDRAHGGSTTPTTCLSCHDQSSWSVGDSGGDR